MIKSTDREKKVKDEVRKALNTVDVFYFMPQAGIYGKSGIPDFVVCCAGRFIGVECKAPYAKNDVSELQKRARDAIQRAKGHWYLVYDDESLALLMDYIYGF